MCDGAIYGESRKEGAAAIVLLKEGTVVLS